MCDMLHHTCSQNSTGDATAADGSGSHSVVGACADVLAALAKCGGSISICSHANALCDLLSACANRPDGTAKKALACVLQLSMQPSCIR
jgi:hypothetical protein